LLGQDSSLLFRWKTEARCFFTIEDVDFIDVASEDAYDGGAVYVVDDADVRPVEALLYNVLKDIVGVVD
jgi:hypothetical protein